MTNDASTDAAPATDHTFFSTLKEGPKRFLAHAIEHGFACGRRSPQDFIRHFPPTAIMRGLEHQASLRAGILVLTTGLKHKIAVKKEWQDAATDLQIALDEGETDAQSIVALFEPDDRVRYLDARKIWAFLIEGEFWKAAGKPAADIARDHVAFLIERALEDKLVTHRDVIEGVTVEELSLRLPKAELGRLIQRALANADKGAPFTEIDLLSTTPIRTLVQHVPLGHVWDTVVVPKIAERHGYVGEAASAPAAPKLPPPPVAPGAAGPDAAREPARSVVAKPKDAGGATPLPRDVAPAPKEASKVKLKSPTAGTDARAEQGPAVAKAPEFFPDDTDDIELMDDDARAG